MQQDTGPTRPFHTHLFPGGRVNGQQLIAGGGRHCQYEHLSPSTATMEPEGSLLIANWM